MILKSLRRDQWEAKLRAIGMRPHEGLGKLNTAEWWSDGQGYPISVPVDVNGDVDFWAFQKIYRDIDPGGIWANWTGDDC